MKVIAVNGGPRKGWNTHTLLSKMLEGAEANGAEVEMVNLYDLNYKGCIGCLGCKRRDGGSVGRCVIKDELRPVLDRVAQCDALILGSPIYLSEVTGELRSFIERLMFPYISYDKMGEHLYKGNITKTAFVFTTNCPEAMYETVGYTRLFQGYQKFFARFFGEGNCKVLTSAETWQIDDYDKYHMGMFDVEAKRRRHEEIFPQECEKAVELGKELTE